MGRPDTCQSCFHHRFLGPSLNTSSCSHSRQWCVWVPWAAVSVGSAPQGVCALRLGRWMSGPGWPCAGTQAGPSLCSALCLGPGRGRVAEDSALASTPRAEAWPACLPSPRRASWPWCGVSAVSIRMEQDGEARPPAVPDAGTMPLTHTWDGRHLGPGSDHAWLSLAWKWDRMTQNKQGGGVGVTGSPRVARARVGWASTPGGAGRKAVGPSGAPPTRPGEGSARQLRAHGWTPGTCRIPAEVLPGSSVT